MEVKTVRVGQMPGRVNEYAVNVGTSVSEVLELAELDPANKIVKVDNEAVNPDEAVVTESTNMILLVAEKVKGN